MQPTFARKIELLAPAKNLDVAIAAINSGADAVYIGANQFGARAAAGNTVEDIANVVKYAHRFDVKVYVTINTILFDDELLQVEKLVWQLYEIGVDALIVQDMALLRMNLPPIALHASTQCDIRTVEKAKFLASVGFSQLVLARELSLSEINNIVGSINIPVEVFVHGALCVSYSGRCTLSCATKHRSANRGECAQLCRLPYDLIDGNGKTVKSQKHLLSLRDMNQSANISQLIKAGATSFKIEGRLKDADYVSNVVAFYRKAIDAEIARSGGELVRSSSGTSVYNFAPQLDKSFNRGFTHYFLQSRRPQQLKMASFDTPKSMGERLGRVKSVRGNKIVLDSDVTIHNGDGLSYFDCDGNYDGFRANSVCGKEITVLANNKFSIKPGDVVYRTFDKEFNDSVSIQPQRRISVNFKLIRKGTDVILRAIDERGIEAETLLSTYSQADKPQGESQTRVLIKTGNTIFSPGDIETLDNVFIPSSVLTAARREVLEAIITNHAHLYVTDRRREEDKSAVFPTNTLAFADNVANRLSSQFYRQHGVTEIQPAAELYETLPRGTRVMTTRYCLRRELGCCLKEGGGSRLAEPLTLSHKGMPNLRLNFDCRNCEMHVILDQ